MVIAEDVQDAPTRPARGENGASRIENRKANAAPRHHTNQLPCVHE